MASTFPLELVTPERILFSAPVHSVRADGVEGSFGVLAGHAPMLVQLKTGSISLTLPDGAQAGMACSGGFLQVTRQKVLILADAAELSEEIDVDRARAARKRALAALEVPGGEIGAEEARALLERAENRIRVAERRPL